MFDDEFMNDMLLNSDAYDIGDNDNANHKTSNKSNGNMHSCGAGGCCCIALLPIILIIALVIFS